MKTIITAALLLAWHLLAISPLKAQSVAGEEIHLGYVRDYIKFRDKQVSPMLYVTNLNALKIGYGRITAKNQWLATISAGTGRLIAPSLGIRQLKFSEDQAEPLYLVPTLYTGELSLTYRRKLVSKAIQTSWAGLQVRETFNYADGLALTTWVVNALALDFTYQTQLQLNASNQIVAEASLPVLTAVSRLPYSNAISRPETSNASAFLKNTSLASLNKFLNPGLTFKYRFSISQRLAVQASYSYQWLHYPEPRLIRSSSHAGSLSFIYQYHFTHL